MYEKVIKRAMDMFFSILGIILLLPLFIIIALSIKIFDKGPILFKQRRVGKNWKEFYIYKFRTMIPDAEKIGVQVTSSEDPRVTTIGKFLRKHKLDEFPQLFNVLKGDMSIVGPRPEVKKYAEMFKKDYDIILKVKPGITDYASIKFIEENVLVDAKKGDIEKFYIEKIMPKKITLYKKYVNDVSFITDLRLIFKTLVKIAKF